MLFLCVNASLILGNRSVTGVPPNGNKGGAVSRDRDGMALSGQDVCWSLCATDCSLLLVSRSVTVTLVRANTGSTEKPEHRTPKYKSSSLPRGFHGYWDCVEVPNLTISRRQIVSDQHVET